MAEVFDWVPSKGFTKESKPTVSNAKFGSGYSQRIILGINNIVSSWNLTFITKTVTEANEIVAFLETHGGSQYFLFTPPGESTQYKVICQEWSVEYTSHISRNITAMFERVYDL